MASDQQILVTVILHHDQSKTLEEITAHTKKLVFIATFPLKGVSLYLGWQPCPMALSSSYSWSPMRCAT